MIVIDWVPNGQGGFFANVLLDPVTSERWVWNGKDDCYDLMLSPEEKAKIEDDADFERRKKESRHPKYRKGTVGAALEEKALKRR